MLPTGGCLSGAVNRGFSPTWIACLIYLEDEAVPRPSPSSMGVLPQPLPVRFSITQYPVALLSPLVAYCPPRRCGHSMARPTEDGGLSRSR